MSKCKVENCNGKFKALDLCNRHYVHFSKYGDLEPRRLYKEELFWKYAIPSESPLDCWSWGGPHFADGYGRMGWEKKSKRAHIISFYIHNGYWPTKLVLHSCDNRPCCNPLHLREGTSADNNADMLARGRQRYVLGEEQPTSKLTAEQVRQIFEAVSEGKLYQRQIGEKYGVCQTLVSQIKLGKKWKHLQLNQV